MMESDEISDAQKLNAAGDIATIRAQITKENPEKTIVVSAWKSLEGIATIATLTEAAYKVGELLAGFLM